jgi:ribosome maturation factor RimP
MFEELCDQIAGKIAPIIDERKFEIIGLSVQRRGRVIAVSLLIDHIDGRINLDECAEINRYLLDWVDQENIIPGEYIVEVSSPGVDRPLQSRRDYERAVGGNIRFYLSAEVQGKKEYAGEIILVQEQAVMINTGKGAVTLPIDKIHKAIPILD